MDGSVIDWEFSATAKTSSVVIENGGKDVVFHPIYRYFQTIVIMLMMCDKNGPYEAFKLFLPMLSLSFAALVRQQQEEKRALLQIDIIIGNYEWAPCYMVPIYLLE